MKKEELATMLGAQATPVEIAQSRLSTTTFNCNQKNDRDVGGVAKCVISNVTL